MTRDIIRDPRRGDGFGEAFKSEVAGRDFTNANAVSDCRRFTREAQALLCVLFDK